MYVSPCDIPARKNNVEISITNEYGTDIYPDLSKNAGLNPCRIDGIEGVIAESDDKLVFSRAKSGDEVIITDDDVIIETRAMDLRLEDITVFFVGSDSIYADADKTIEYYDKILASLKTDKYLIVGPVTGSHNVINDINEVLSEEYGDKYFNIFEFLCTDAIDQERMIFTDEELENAENRIEVPKAFLSENLNSFNSEGSDIVGRRIAEILDELGYLE